MHLIRLVYYSENRLDSHDGPILGALQRILATSQRNNAARGITGALAFDNLWFFQALEGERDAVWPTFMKIMADTRHDEVMLAGCTPIESRVFGDWSMRLISCAPEAEALFAPFTHDGIVRPGLMSEADIVDALRGMILAADRPRVPSGPLAPEEMGRDRLPGTAAVAP